MPKKVVESKVGNALWSLGFTTVFFAIPIIVFAFISINHPDVWQAPYPKFVLYYLIAHTFFAVVVTMLSHLHKALWITLQTIAALGTFGLLVYAYVVQDALLLHVATATVFTLMMYLTSDNNSDGPMIRYTIPVICVIAGLITVLWFVGVNMSIIAHIVIVSVLNFIFVIIYICSLVNHCKNGRLDTLINGKLVYEMDTDEEIKAKKDEKDRIRYEKLSRKVEARREKEEIKRIHDSDPDVIAKREKAEKRRKKAGKAAKAVFGTVGNLLLAMIPGRAPIGSDEWEEDEWGRYIKDRVERAPAGRHGTFYVDYYPGYKEIEILVTFDAYSDCSTSEYNSSVGFIKDNFRSACKHCPYSVSLRWR